MSALSSCQKCRGFVPPASAECVHCGAPMMEAPRGGVMVKGLFCLASAGVAAITLMACYGMPPCDTPAPDGGTDSYHCYDQEPVDGDGGTLSDGGTQPTDGGVDGGH
ncbi:hypothetical protein [Vitiosangium sp. GDMCC 1.1324]|uniref:hypothetical protein n=1 Tax=Vitiosangium sp. (strain GDMCC 1.1324) TaxID=2138576 RepID=UPI000D390FCD|nr:hypothetical protein [Vitiosangium sp. GDMCC 1.1324]PTL80626.1 hypothetical protein DAT35_28790 [Vitiosangium sp. GDMCC 1.1324]